MIIDGMRLIFNIWTWIWIWYEINLELSLKPGSKLASENIHSAHSCLVAGLRKLLYPRPKIFDGYSSIVITNRPVTGVLSIVLTHIRNLLRQGRHAFSPKYQTGSGYQSIHCAIAPIFEYGKSKTLVQNRALNIPFRWLINNYNYQADIVKQPYQISTAAASGRSTTHSTVCNRDKQAREAHPQPAPDVRSKTWSWMIHHT